MTLIDTSCWIEAMRKSGDANIRAQVGDLLRNDQAAWCPMVQLELWNGLSNPKARQFITELATIHSLPLDAHVWELACQMAQQCRAIGTPVPSTDALIAACARFHSVPLLHNDKHFDWLLKLP